jgi:Mg/Co/Ni transporter MgtE
MDTTIEERPWDKLRDLALVGDRGALEAMLEELPASEVLRALLRLDPEDQRRLLTTLDPSDAAELIEEVPDQHAADMVERLSAAEAASILQELQSDDQADLIGDIEKKEAEAILAEMAPEAAEDVRRLAEYDPETAGGLMMTEVFAFDGRPRELSRPASLRRVAVPRALGGGFLEEPSAVAGRFATEGNHDGTSVGQSRCHTRRA